MKDLDLDIYTTEMSKSIWDKAFFMDKIPGAKCVIDFGCADGAMIRYLSGLFPDIMFIGYDCVKELIDLAQGTPPFNANLRYYLGGTLRSGNEVLIEYVRNHYKPEEICLNFSSVLHEVYSSTGGLHVIQQFVRVLKPKYITIRDMYCDEPGLSFTSEEFWRIWGPLNARASNAFVNKYGEPKDWRDLTHLMMKIQWKDNGYDDELEEDYYSWDIHRFLDDIKADYAIAFECRYQLPYLSEKWKKEFDGWYNPDIHTHAQFILRRME